jgi:hypothetical protein
MSIRHPELCELIESICFHGEPLSEHDRALLIEYANADAYIEDQLDRVTRELAEEFTGNDDVWSPQRAARSVLATLDG